MTSITTNGQVEFRFFRPNVSSVKIVGDFNRGQPHSIEMHSAGDGWWTALLGFDVGDYRFRYLADGEWFSDYASYGLEPTRTGFTSILRVPGMRGATQNSCAKQVA